MTNIEDTTSPRSQIANQIIKIINKKSSLEIISFTGNGCGYLVENTLKENKFDYQFINLQDQPTTLKNVNIIILQPFNVLENIKLIDTLFRKASSFEKFIIIIETPNIIDGHTYNSSYFSKHVYQRLYLPTANLAETKQIIHSLNTNILKEADTIFSLTGGISRLIKLICNDISLSSQKFPNQTIELALKPIFESISVCPKQTLQRLNLVNQINTFTSQWLQQYKKLYSSKKPNIQISHDLTITENNQNNNNSFTKTETDIINHLLLNEIASRDQIASIKWDNLSYEKYSDEAINKTISRINSKLATHQIAPIHKLGYKLKNLIGTRN